MAKNSDKTSYPTARILPCDCQHEYQDRMYGKGQRVHNPFGKDKLMGYRCTVCSSKKEKSTW